MDSPANSTSRMTTPYLNLTGTQSQTSFPVRSSSVSRKPAIYDRNLNRSRGLELSHSAYALLFAEMVTYAQNKVEGIAELERRLNEMGYRVGQRILELIVWREKNSKRETRILGILQFIHTVVWKTLFGKPADSLEKSREHDDECWFLRIPGLIVDMVQDNAPMITKFISVPQSMSQLNCGAYLAGIIEAILDSTMFFTQRVTAHSTGDETAPQRCTILIKFQRDVVERDAMLK